MANYTASDITTDEQAALDQVKEETEAAVKYDIAAKNAKDEDTKKAMLDNKYDEIEHAGLMGAVAAEKEPKDKKRMMDGVKELEEIKSESTESIGESDFSKSISQCIKERMSSGRISSPGTFESSFIKASELPQRRTRVPRSREKESVVVRDPGWRFGSYRANVPLKDLVEQVQDIGYTSPGGEEGAPSIRTARPGVKALPVNEGKGLPVKFSPLWTRGSNPTGFNTARLEEYLARQAAEEAQDRALDSRLAKENGVEKQYNLFRPNTEMTLQDLIYDLVDNFIDKSVDAEGTPEEEQIGRYVVPDRAPLRKEYAELKEKSDELKSELDSLTSELENEEDPDRIDEITASIQPLEDERKKIESQMKDLGARIDTKSKYEENVAEFIRAIDQLMSENTKPLMGSEIGAEENIGVDPELAARYLPEFTPDDEAQYKKLFSEMGLSDEDIDRMIKDAPLWGLGSYDPDAKVDLSNWHITNDELPNLVNRQRATANRDYALRIAKDRFRQRGHDMYGDDIGRLVAEMGNKAGWSSKMLNNTAFMSLLRRGLVFPPELFRSAFGDNEFMYDLMKGGYLSPEYIKKMDKDNGTNVASAMRDIFDSKLANTYGIRNLPIADRDWETALKYHNFLNETNDAYAEILGAMGIDKGKANELSEKVQEILGKEDVSLDEAIDRALEELNLSIDGPYRAPLTTVMERKLSSGIEDELKSSVEVNDQTLEQLVELGAKDEDEAKALVEAIREKVDGGMGIYDAVDASLDEFNIPKSEYTVGDIGDIVGSADELGDYLEDTDDADNKYSSPAVLAYRLKNKLNKPRVSNESAETLDYIAAHEEYYKKLFGEDHIDELKTKLEEMEEGKQAAAYETSFDSRSDITDPSLYQDKALNTIRKDMEAEKRRIAVDEARASKDAEREAREASDEMFYQPRDKGKPYEETELDREERLESEAQEKEEAIQDQISDDVDVLKKQIGGSTHNTPEIVSELRGAADAAMKKLASVDTGGRAELERLKGAFSTLRGDSWLPSYASTIASPYMADVYNEILEKKGATDEEGRPLRITGRTYDPRNAAAMKWLDKNGYVLNKGAGDGTALAEELGVGTKLSKDAERNIEAIDNKGNDLYGLIDMLRNFSPESISKMVNRGELNDTEYRRISQALGVLNNYLNTSGLAKQDLSKITEQAKKIPPAGLKNMPESITPKTDDEGIAETVADRMKIYSDKYKEASEKEGPDEKAARVKAGKPIDIGPITDEMLANETVVPEIKEDERYRVNSPRVPKYTMTETMTPDGNKAPMIVLAKPVKSNEKQRAESQEWHNENDLDLTEQYKNLTEKLSDQPFSVRTALKTLKDMAAPREKIDPKTKKPVLDPKTGEPVKVSRIKSPIDLDEAISMIDALRHDPDADTKGLESTLNKMKGGQNYNDEVAAFLQELAPLLKDPNATVFGGSDKEDDNKPKAEKGRWRMSQLAAMASMPGAREREPRRGGYRDIVMGTPNMSNIRAKREAIAKIRKQLADDFKGDTTSEAYRDKADQLAKEAFGDFSRLDSDTGYYADHLLKNISDIFNTSVYDDPGVLKALKKYKATASPEEFIPVAEKMFGELQDKLKDRDERFADFIDTNYTKAGPMSSGPDLSVWEKNFPGIRERYTAHMPFDPDDLVGGEDRWETRVLRDKDFTDYKTGLPVNIDRISPLLGKRTEEVVGEDGKSSFVDYDDLVFSEDVMKALAAGAATPDAPVEPLATGRTVPKGTEEEGPVVADVSVEEPVAEPAKVAVPVKRSATESKCSRVRRRTDADPAPTDVGGLTMKDLTEPTIRDDAEGSSVKHMGDTVIKKSTSELMKERLRRH